jgi:hypothetical protein
MSEIRKGAVTNPADTAFVLYASLQTPRMRGAIEEIPPVTGELPVSLSGRIEQSNNPSEVRSIVGE